METKAIILIEHLLTLTQRGKIFWKRKEPEWFEAETPKETFSVEFIYLMRPDAEGSDLTRTMARLRAFGLSFDYCIGTQGYDLLCDMLALNDPSWTSWRESCQKRFDEGMASLQQLLED